MSDAKFLFICFLIVVSGAIVPMFYLFLGHMFATRNKKETKRYKVSRTKRENDIEPIKDEDEEKPNFFS